MTLWHAPQTPQEMALLSPGRVLSMCSIMSTTFEPELPDAPVSLRLLFTKAPPANEEEAVRATLTVPFPHLWHASRSRACDAVAHPRPLADAHGANAVRAQPSKRCFAEEALFQRRTAGALSRTIVFLCLW